LDDLTKQRLINILNKQLFTVIDRLDQLEQIEFAVNTDQFVEYEFLKDELKDLIHQKQDIQNNKVQEAK